MNRMLYLSCISLLLLIGCDKEPSRQSLFGSTEQAPTAARVTPDKPVRLPADHAAHPAYQLEWWYMTAVLEDTRNVSYGLQFTLFRFATDSGEPSNWSNGQRWMAHASLHTPDSHFFESRYAAGGVGNAGVTSEPFRAFLDDWRWQGHSNAPVSADMSFKIDDKALVNLSLERVGPFVLQGKDGFSIKSADGKYRSYYYSLPFIDINGKLQINDSTHRVSGSGWYDHEWTSELANENALGWDWFSLHLNNGDKVMAFRMHVKDTHPYTIGTYITQAGHSISLASNEISITPTGSYSVAGRTMPLDWQLIIPAKKLKIQISPFKISQWNPGQFPYYEGRVKLSGTHTGNGFMELTGY